MLTRQPLDAHRKGKAGADNGKAPGLPSCPEKSMATQENQSRPR